MLGKFRFWGAATVGTKGQIVIPADARESLGIKEGDKLLFASTSKSNTLIIMRPEVLEEYMARMQTTLQDMLTANETQKEDA